MSQAKRARFCSHGTSVKLSRSGIAAMSGSLGIWPISPAAKPAKPAPSCTRSSRLPAGMSFALGRPYMSTNCAKKNSTPRPFAIFWISSSLGSVATAMAVLLVGWPPGCITLPKSRVRADSSTPRRRSCVRRGRPQGVPEADELHGDLDHQPVVATEVDAREVADPAQPLAEGVRMDEEGLRGAADVAAAAEELLERGEQRAGALPVVVGELRHGVDGGIPRARIERDPEEVLVRAELLVAHDPTVAAHHGLAEERVPRLLEAVSKRFGADADARDADRRGSARVCVCAIELVQRRGGVAGCHRQQRAEGLVARVENRAADERADRFLEPVGDPDCGDDDVRLVEVAAEARRTAFEGGAESLRREIVEEVLDEVLLGQALEHLDLLHGDRRLVRDRPREVELARTDRDEGAEQLSARNERDGDAGALPASGELRAEIGESELRGSRSTGRCGEANVQAFVERVE